MKLTFVLTASIILSGCAINPGEPREVGAYTAAVPVYPACSRITLTQRPERTQTQYASVCEVR